MLADTEGPAPLQGTDPFLGAPEDQAYGSKLIVRWLETMAI